MTTKVYPRIMAKNQDVLSCKVYSVRPTVRTDGTAIAEGDVAYSDGTASTLGFGDQGEGLYVYNGAAWIAASPLAATVLLSSTAQVVGASGAKNFKGAGSLLRRGQEVKTHFIVESRTVAAQPGSPSEGQHWLLPGSLTGGVWGGYTTGNLAAYTDSAFEQITAVEGLSVWVKDENVVLFYDGSAWVRAETKSRYEFTSSGAATFDIAKRISEISKTDMWLGGALLRSSVSAQYSITIDTPSAGQTRFTITDSGLVNESGMIVQINA